MFDLSTESIYYLAELLFHKAIDDVLAIAPELESAVYELNTADFLAHLSTRRGMVNNSQNIESLSTKIYWASVQNTELKLGRKDLVKTISIHTQIDSCQRCVAQLESNTDQVAAIN